MIFHSKDAMPRHVATMDELNERLIRLELLLEDVLERLPARRRPVTSDGSAVAWNKKVGFVNINLEMMNVMKSSYPSIDVAAELGKMHAWLLTNPGRAGKRNWLRFINNWLARSHDTPRAGGGPVALKMRDEQRHIHTDRGIELRRAADDAARQEACSPQEQSDWWRKMQQS